MPIQITKDSPLAVELAKLFSVPAERIQHVVIVVKYDTGIAMAHSLCCEKHAREGLALIAATPPDLFDTTDYGGTN